LFGWPAHGRLQPSPPECPKLLPGREYILCYTPAQRVALWAAYQLRAEEVISATRRDAFRADPRLTNEDNAHCDDYKGSGYGRGHTVPNADMNRSRLAQANTFFLSNMSPQSPALNRGLWRYLEELVREYAEEYGVIYVLAGSILQDPGQTVPSGRVGIPSRYYKTLLRVDANGTVAAALSIELPNLLEGLPLPHGTAGATRVNGSAPRPVTPAWPAPP
jgi:endonuclease G